MQGIDTRPPIVFLLQVLVPILVPILEFLALVFLLNCTTLHGECLRRP